MEKEDSEWGIKPSISGKRKGDNLYIYIIEIVLEGLFISLQWRNRSIQTGGWARKMGSIPLYSNACT